MIQEYLFSDKSTVEKAHKYQPKGVFFEVEKIDNSECWIITYSLSGQNEQVAKILSEINTTVIDTFHPVTLTNESSAYFNKKLYPFFNEFERKLRKLLYLKGALNPGDKASENIKDLELKNLNEIFVLLFTDEEFVKKIRTKTNNKTWQFSRAELRYTIDQIKEDTYWDRLIGEKTVPEFRENYFTVKNYRNDVMHAHNTTYNEYNAAKKLLKSINEQLDVEIGNILALAEQPDAHSVASDYNTTLSQALNSMKLSRILNEYAQQASAIQASFSSAFMQMQEMYSKLPMISPEQYRTMESLSQLAQKAQLSQDMLEFKQRFLELQQSLYPLSEDMEGFRKTVEELGQAESDRNDHDNNDALEDASSETPSLQDNESENNEG